MEITSFIFGILTGVTVVGITFLFLILKLRAWSSTASSKNAYSKVSFNIDDLRQPMIRSEKSDVRPESLAQCISRIQGNNANSALFSIAEEYLSKSVRDCNGPETAVWFNVQCSRLLTFLTKFGEAQDSNIAGNSDGSIDENVKSNGGLFLRALLNDMLKNKKLPSPLHSLEISSLHLGTTQPLINSVNIIPSDPEEPLLLDIDFTYAGDSTGEFQIVLGLYQAIKDFLSGEPSDEDEKNDIRDTSDPFIMLPATVAFSNLFFSGKIRLCVDTVLESPAISFAFQELPTIRFNIGTAVGYLVQIVTVNALPALLHSIITRTLFATAVSPNMVSLCAPQDLINKYVIDLLKLVKQHNKAHAD